MASKMKDNDVWIVDSGSTSNMTNKKEYFTELKPESSRIGVAKEDEVLIVKGTGNIEFGNCVLRDVMYVPDLKTNLLSVNTITENGGEVRFKGKEVEITHNNKMVMKGEKLQNGLFQVKLKRTVKKQQIYSMQATKGTAINWHRTLGHIGNENLKALLKISEGINLTKADLEELNKT